MTSETPEIPLVLLLVFRDGKIFQCTSTEKYYRHERHPENAANRFQSCTRDIIEVVR